MVFNQSDISDTATRDCIVVNDKTRPIANGKKGYAAVFGTYTESDSEAETFKEKRARILSTPVAPYSNSVLYDKGILAASDTTFSLLPGIDHHTGSLHGPCSSTIFVTSAQFVRNGLALK